VLSEEVERLEIYLFNLECWIKIDGKIKGILQGIYISRVAFSPECR
jgi:hypothetical protein